MKAITFVNKDGKTMRLPANATLADLVRSGFDGFKLAKPNEKLGPGWWKNVDRRPKPDSGDPTHP